MHQVDVALAKPASALENNKPLSNMRNGTYVRQMPNILQSLSLEQRQFIDEMAALLSPWGMPPAMASIYAYLLICEQPQSLDHISCALVMAKSSASVAARGLEQVGLVRRHSERGSRRVRYGASESYSGFLANQARVLDDIGVLAQNRAVKVASGSTLVRLRYLASFHRKMAATIRDRISELSDEYLRQGPDEDLK